MTDQLPAGFLLSWDTVGGNLRLNEQAIEVGDCVLCGGEVLISRGKNGEPPTIHCVNGCSDEAQADRVLEMVLRGERLPEKPTVGTISAEELDTKSIEPLRAIVPGLVYEGLNAIAGPPKAGKSALVGCICEDLPAGNKILGRIVAEPCEVLYLALEDNERRVKDRGRARRCGQPAPKGLTYITRDSKPPMLRLGAGGEGLIESFVKAHPKCRLVVVDTWTRIKPRKPKNQPDYDADAAAWDILADLAARLRIGILVVHHTRKALKPGGDWLEEVSGTNGVTGTCDTILMFRRSRGEKVGILYVTSRDLDEDRELVLEGDPVTKRWFLSDKSPEESRLGNRQSKIAEVLYYQPDIYPREIAGAMGEVNDNAVRQVLMRMQQMGYVQVDRGRYRLSPDLHRSLSLTLSTTNNRHNSHNGSNASDSSNGGMR